MESEELANYGRGEDCCGHGYDDGSGYGTRANARVYHDGCGYGGGASGSGDDRGDGYGYGYGDCINSGYNTCDGYGHDNARSPENIDGTGGYG
jgi:hypothetical protein